MYTRDTIAAIATPPGKGGIGIIRISGQAALQAAQRLFVARAGGPIRIPSRMYYGDFVDARSNPIDTGYCVWFKGPRSFTGEDVVEFHCHGGMVILHMLLQELFALGIRPAEPGEFSRRAFLNGKIDLVQADAIADMINAQSQQAVKIARSHFAGNLSANIEDIRRRLLDIIAWLEAEIDYPEADIDYAGKETAAMQVQQQTERLQVLLNTYQEGKIFRDGIVTVILGKPNVGKSSLLNSLVGEERAIVTDIPGTTRDVVEVPATVRGIPLRLADTAGIRQSLNKIEQLGIERARVLAERADLVLLVLDRSRPLGPEDRQLLAAADAERTIVALNKSDLPGTVQPEDIRSLGFQHVLPVSALTGAGLDELRDAIEAAFVKGDIGADTVWITNERHFHALQRAAGVLKDLVARWNDTPLDLLALDLREAWQALGEITGAVWTEELLDCIFSNFCLGK